MTITNRLQDLRMEAGKTQAQVVDEICRQEGRRVFSRGMLSHFERGAHQPYGDALAALCRYYRVQPGDILRLGGADEPRLRRRIRSPREDSSRNNASGTRHH